MKKDRYDQLTGFYAALSELSEKVGGTRRLSACSGRMNWPRKGVYFFFEPGEYRCHTGKGLRVVRVGTHAIASGSKTRLWSRLSQHKGPARSGGGNHRGSIFRLIVGTALLERDSHNYSTWGKGSSAPRQIREAEHAFEMLVSKAIGDMPFLWLGIEDESGPASLRGYIERNAISLLSNYERSALDPPSPDWLGRYCNRERVRTSGLWNSNHVNDFCDPNFLDVFSRLINEMAPVE